MNPQIPKIDNWKKGQTGRGAAKAGYEAKRTEPPKPYTEASLLADMKNAAKFIANPKLRDAMKEAQGMGTPATRAPTIEKLKRIKFFEVVKGDIRSTPQGQAVIAGLPPELSDPGTTALWEEMLAKIARGEMEMDKFMGLIESQTAKLVIASDTVRIQGAGKGSGGAGPGAREKKPVDVPCPVCGGALSMEDRWVKCEKGDFTLFREVAGLKLKDGQLLTLVRSGRLGPVDGFYSAAKKKKFSATLLLEEGGKTKFDFSKK